MQFFEPVKLKYKNNNYIFKKYEIWNRFSVRDNFLIIQLFSNKKRSFFFKQKLEKMLV